MKLYSNKAKNIRKQRREIWITFFSYVIETMMAGSPVSFNILKGKHAVFIQHTTCQNVNYNSCQCQWLQSIVTFFLIFTERLRSSPGGGQGGVSYVICKLNLYLLRKDVPLNLNNYTILFLYQTVKTIVADIN